MPTNCVKRRRTQIRLAQRAYRQRKETTIVDLNARVADLERTINVMNRLVAEFSDTATASGLHEVQPALAQNLQTVALRVNDIASSNAPSQDNRARAKAPNFSARTYPAAEAGETIESINAMESGIDDSAFRERSTETSISSPWGYVFGAEEEAQDGKEGDSYDASASLVPRRDEEQSLMETVNDSDGSYSLIPLSTKRLAPPATYTFQESTFARRLLRAALERADRVMMDPVRNAGTIQSMCRFNFCFNNFENIRRWISNVIRRTEKESLELWQASFLHLGGAGLHYPRTSLDGSGSAAPSFWADKSPMGPKAAIPQTPMPEWMTIDQVIEYTGFQGDWFDPNDVEHYLKSKGVHVDAKSSLAEFDVTVDPTLKALTATPFSSFTSSATGSEPESHKNAELPMAGGSPLQGISDLVADASTDVDFATHLERWSSSPGASLIDGDFAVSSTRSKQMLDVDKFISSKLSFITIPKPLSILTSPSNHRASILPRPNSGLAKREHRLSDRSICARGHLKLDQRTNSEDASAFAVPRLFCMISL